MQNIEATFSRRILGRNARGLMLIVALVAGAASLSLGGCTCVDSDGSQLQCPNNY